MALKKLCSKTGCNKVIDNNQRYCSRHEYIDRERYKEYQKRRLKDKEQKKFQSFYNSSEWRRTRKLIASSFYNIDILEYYTTGRIVQGECVHHIKEISEDWNCRLDLCNLIYLSECNHRRVHSIYDSNKEKKRKLQKKLYEIIDIFHRTYG